MSRVSLVGQFKEIVRVTIFLFQPLGPRKTSPKRRMLLISSILFAAIVIPAGLMALRYENVLLTTGPSRKEVVATAETIIRSDVPKLPGHPALGSMSSYYESCGHQDGVQPLSGIAGATIRISGVESSQHGAFEKSLDERMDQESASLSADREWVAFVTWDSDKSMTGEVEVGTNCTPIARWP